MRIDLENVVKPKFAPWTVTLADPVPARFPGLAVLIDGRSVDHDDVRLPTNSPDVKVILRVPKTEDDDLQKMNVSEIQTVDSELVDADRNLNVYIKDPKP